MREKPSRELGVLVAAALFVQVTSGCLSNEYVIPQDELQRVAALPPDARGAHVRVVQDLGDRRDEAIEPPPPAEADGSLNVQLDLHGPGGGGDWGGGHAS